MDIDHQPENERVRGCEAVFLRLQDDTYKQLWESQKSKARRLEDEAEQLRDDLEVTLLANQVVNIKECEDQLNLTKKKLMHSEEQIASLATENEALRAEIQKMQQKFRHFEEQNRSTEEKLSKLTIEYVSLQKAKE